MRPPRVETIYPPLDPRRRAKGAVPVPRDDSEQRSTPESAIDLGGGVWLAAGDARWSFSRSSGPGGQNVNKVNSRAELRVAIVSIRGMNDAARARLRGLAGSRLVRDSELAFVGDESRSQLDNREACVARLRELVTRALVVPKQRRKTKPTRGSKERRLEGKRRDSVQKSNRRKSED